MITKKNLEVINFIYSTGYATIDQIAKIFYNHSKYAYDMARRDLNKILREDKYLRMFRNSPTNQNIYTPIESKISKISYHNVKALDYLANLKGLGVEIEKVEREKDLGGVIPDLYVVFTFNGCRYYQLVEIQTRHESVDVNRYLKVEDVINSLSNGNPSDLVIIQNTRKNYDDENQTNLKIIQLDLDMSEIAKVLI